MFICYETVEKDQQHKESSMSTTKPYRARRGLESAVHRSGLENKDTHTRKRKKKKRKKIGLRDNQHIGLFEEQKTMIVRH